MMMSSFADTNIILGDDTWFSGSQMFNYINTDDLSSLDIQQPMTVYQQVPQQQQAQHNQHRNQQVLIECKLDDDYFNQLELKSPKLDNILPFQIDCSPQNNYQFNNQTTSGEQDVLICNPGNEYLGPPPVLMPKSEQRVLSIKQHLEYRKAMSRERHEQLRTQLDQEPLHLPPRVIKKPTGKKMTGRERQIELERQEIEELKRRDRYVDMISNLEAKNNRLREILVDIVTKSPDLNREIIDWLSEDNLLIDPHIDGLSHRL